MNAAIHFQLSSRAGVSTVPVLDLQRSDLLFAAARPHRGGHTQSRLPTRWSSGVWQQGVTGVQCAAFYLWPPAQMRKPQGYPPCSLRRVTSASGSISSQIKNKQVTH